MSKQDDYFTAKTAWEKEHPGEYYTSAMHYAPGRPHARVVNYFTQYAESAPLSCPACGWEGTTEQGVKERYDELFDVSCPKCDKMLLIVPYPTKDEIQAAAAAGNAEAQRELARLKTE